jgi:hypothetical protein
MKASHEDYAEWVPALDSDTNLYHDNLLGRWVIAGLNQVIFLNISSYEVLKRCDGKTPIDDICDQLSSDGVFQGDSVEHEVRRIIQNFDSNGFLRNRSTTTF